MQATKPVTKWQKFWKRANRRTPFWKQRLEDRTEGELAPAGLIVNFGRWMVDIFDTLFALAMGAVVVSAVTILLIAPLFLSPDFMTVGLADPIGRGLAAVCLSTGQCNPAYLLAGTAVAVLILLLIAYVVGVSLRDDHDEETVSDEELRSGLSAIDERLVALRAEFVAAGLLKITQEEVADQALLDGLVVCETCGIVGGGHRADCPEGAEAG